jgi:glycosyltransferase involved in cell wall biosynthesis
MSLTVLFCGPIALEGAPPVGGYEACNVRTIAALRAKGVSIAEQYYPQPRGGAAAKLRGYVRGFRDLLRAMPRTRGQVFHLTGLYKHFALPELLLMRRARALGLKTVYDVRAGSMYRHYARLGPVYRWLFRALLRSADVVMVEGQDYDRFVREVTGKPAFYLPNHLPTDHLPARQPAQPGEPLRLLYVGRITLDKGVETALQTAQALRAAGIDCEIGIAGGGDPALLERLRASYPFANWLGSLTSAAVLAELGRSHIFLFATRHTGEGHSNALTEAMAMGCVPVASDNGFNKTVIGPAGRVLPLTAEAPDYAAAIRQLWLAGEWPALSAAAASRTRELFSTDQAVDRLIGAYHSLMES